MGHLVDCIIVDAILPIGERVYFPYPHHLCQVWPNDLLWLMECK